MTLQTSIVAGWGKEFDIGSVSHVEVIDGACAGVDDAFISFQTMSLGKSAASDMRFTGG